MYNKSMMQKEFEKFMKIALKEAQKAELCDEVPVGAVVVLNGKVVAKAHNQKNQKKNALLHAEMIALNKAQKKLDDWHLCDAVLFVTLEPCPMCAGACINSRIKTVVFGAKDPKAGCFESVFNFSQGQFNHKPEIVSGILEKECGEILTNYFKQKRSQKCKLKKPN